MFCKFKLILDLFSHSPLAVSSSDDPSVVSVEFFPYIFANFIIMLISMEWKLNIQSCCMGLQMVLYGSCWWVYIANSRISQGTWITRSQRYLANSVPHGLENNCWVWCIWSFSSTCAAWKKSWRSCLSYRTHTCL